MITARDIMTTDVRFIDPDEPIERAIDLMLEHHVSGLPVVNSNGEVLGVITEYDVLDIINNASTERYLVYHFMTRDPVTVDINTSIFELGWLFRQNSVRRYPVLENGRLAGIVSRRELVRYVYQTRCSAKEAEEQGVRSSSLNS